MCLCLWWSWRWAIKMSLQERTCHLAARSAVSWLPPAAAPSGSTLSWSNVEQSYPSGNWWFSLLLPSSSSSHLSFHRCQIYILVWRLFLTHSTFFLFCLSHTLPSNKMMQLCLNLCFPRGLSLPPVHHGLCSLSCGCACVLSRFSHVWLFATPWTVALQAPLSMGFPRQEYWSGLLCPPPGDLPDPGLKPTSLMSPALAGRFSTTCATWEPPLMVNTYSLYLEKRSPWKQQICGVEEWRTASYHS